MHKLRIINSYVDEYSLLVVKSIIKQSVLVLFLGFFVFLLYHYNGSTLRYNK